MQIPPPTFPPTISPFDRLADLRDDDFEDLLDAMDEEEAEPIAQPAPSPQPSVEWDSARANSTLSRVIAKRRSELSNEDVRELKHIVDHPELVTEFSLYENRLFSAQKLKTLLRKFTRLEKVDLSLVSEELADCKLPDGLEKPFHGATDNYVSGLLDIIRLHSSHIRELSINHVPAVKADPLVLLIKSIPNLQVLRLNSCQSLRDEHLSRIATCTRKLERLELAHSEYIRGEGLVQLIRSNPRLKHLSLERCYAITPGYLLEIAEQTDHLESLNLMNLDQCTEDIVQQFLATNAELKPERCLV